MITGKSGTRLTTESDSAGAAPAEAHNMSAGVATDNTAHALEHQDASTPENNNSLI